ncbi:MAG: glycoside hydrolase family 113 [Beijerinckiaceae bacterium]
MLFGANVVRVPVAPFGSPAARRSLVELQRVGADVAAIIPFFWQPDRTSVEIVAGADMDLAEIRRAVADARAAGLMPVMKPHVWIDGSWAGEVAAPEDRRAAWFARYKSLVIDLAKLSEEEGVPVFFIGTELAKLSGAAEWELLVRTLRGIYRGRLGYVAHGVDDAEKVPFWPLLDIIGLSLYPPMGADDDAAGRLALMQAQAARLEALSEKFAGKPVWITEIGLRSAIGAAAKPWESAEERVAPPDPILQARVLADWHRALRSHRFEAVLVWRWFTDPLAGGPADTDFTVQNKPASGVLLCFWSGLCR